MAVPDTHTIDLIAEAHDQGPIRLYIIEDRPWSLSAKRVEELETKVTAYFNFIVSGQLHRKAPASIGRKCIVELHCQHEPPPEALAIFPQIEALFARQNVGFRVIHVCLDYGEPDEVEVYPGDEKK